MSFNFCQRSSIAAGREFIARQAPELKLIEKIKFKITTKSPKEFRPPEPLLIVNYSRLLQRPACSNTKVCVQRSCLCDGSRPLGGRSGATFTIKPVVCCVALRSRVVDTFATLSAGCTTGASVRVERTVKRL